MSKPTLYICDRCHGYGEFKYDLNKRIDCAGCNGEGWVTLDKLRTKLPSETTDELFGDTVIGILKAAGTTRDKGMAGSIPFKVGDIFTTLGGLTVECIQLSETRGYETARFSDGGWRYNREHDRGRCTACRWDEPGNIVPNYPAAAPDPVWGLCPHKKKTGGCPFHNLQCGYPKCDTTPSEK